MYFGFINIYAFVLSAIIIFLITFIYYLVDKYANNIEVELRDFQNVFLNL